MLVNAMPHQNIHRACVQEVFADIKDDDDDDFEVVPVKPTKTGDNSSDGLCCNISTIFTV